MANPQPGREIPLATYAGHPIPNRIDPDPTQGMIALASRAHQGLLRLVQQTGPATGRYNCHGLVFASRRTNISPPGMESGDLIDRILHEDHYRRVDETDVAEGDIVVWRQAAEVDHTGIVCHIQRDPLRVIRVWSMWGGLGEFVHPVGATPYNDCALEYWRLP